MTSVRKILHLDLDAFFCAVEEQRDPSLSEKPFAVGGRPETRGVVASCSYAARAFGVHSAMPMAQAVRLCRGLVIVPSRHGAYERASAKVMERLNALTPLVERVSIDEAFLDVTSRPEPGEAVARELQRTIREDLGLPCSLGVAASKLVAKIANNVGKASARSEGPPNAILVVPRGKEAEFLAPLPVKALWGVGPKTAAGLVALGMRTIGDLARCQEADLVRRFGAHGHSLALHARGIDDESVEVVHETKSISKETTFAQDVGEQDVLEGTLLALAEGVGRELRREGLKCRTVNLKFRRPDFTTLTRQVTLREPTDLDQRIYMEAKRLMEKVWRPGQRVRLIGVGASRLAASAEQLSLWDPGSEKEEHLQEAIDSLRERFGNQAVRWGTERRRGDG